MAVTGMGPPWPSGLGDLDVLMPRLDRGELAGFQAALVYPALWPGGARRADLGKAGSSVLVDDERRVIVRSTSPCLSRAVLWPGLGHLRPAWSYQLTGGRRQWQLTAASMDLLSSRSR